MSLRRAIHQVAGKLLDREAVERLVGVERTDHVVAKEVKVDMIVAVIAGRVGETDQVEPEDRHAFAVVRRREQPVDEPLVSVGPVSFTKASTSAGVGGKPIRSKLSRRISVRRSASGAGSSCSWASRARMNRSISLLGPGWPGAGRNGRPRRRKISPVPFPLEPLRRSSA